MRLNNTLYLCIFMALAAPLALSGCSKKKTEAGAEAGVQKEEKAGGDAEASGASEPLETAASKDEAGEGKFSEGRTSGPMLPIYFDFDSSSIREDQVERIEHNGDFLKSSNKAGVRIEGNCDQRGSNEYNLALGERRAQTAKKYLIRLGVDKGRLSTVSWGEEKPLVSGQDETSWAQNRRDDFVLVE